MSTESSLNEGLTCNRFDVAFGLPVEVLSMIFESLTRIELNSLCPYAHWLSVSHVCHQWRDVALNFPPMWAKIYFPSNMHLIRLFIERSNDAPLSIYSFDGRARGEEMVFLLQQSHRLKEVYFQDCEPEFLPMFNDLQFPILEVLVLGACWFSPMLANIQFAPEVAAGAIPPLQELRLTLCYLNLDIPFLSNLRSLSIVHRPGAVTQPVREVLCALKQMKHLESLELTRSLGFSDNIPQNFCVELPQLRLLRLCVEDPQVLRILKNIACPSMQTIVARSDTHLGRFATDILVAEVSAAFYSLIPGTPSSWIAKASLVMGAQYSANTMTILPPSSTSPPSQLVLLGRGNSIGIMFSQLQLGSPLPLQTLDVVLTDSSHLRFDWGIFYIATCVYQARHL